MFTTKITYLFTLVLVTGLFACGNEINKTEPETPVSDAVKKTAEHNPHMKVVKSADNKNKDSQLLTISGQIVYQRIEGGFYSLIATNGAKYTLLGLNDEYRKNGLIVELKVEKLPDLITTTQFGESVKILDVKVLDSSKISVTSKNM